MPLYEYKCKRHNVFEQLHSVKNRPDKVQCIFLDENFNACSLPARIQVSAPTMKPDPHWNGTVTQSGKVVFSKSEYEEDNKYLVPATEANVSHVIHKREEVKEERAVKHEKKVEHFLANQLAGVTIDSDGSSVKQRNKFNKMRR